MGKCSRLVRFLLLLLSCVSSSSVSSSLRLLLEEKDVVVGIDVEGTCAEQRLSPKIEPSATFC